MHSWVGLHLFYLHWDRFWGEILQLVPSATHSKGRPGLTNHIIPPTPVSQTPKVYRRWTGKEQGSDNDAESDPEMAENRGPQSPEMIRESITAHRISVPISEAPQQHYGVNHHSTIPALNSGEKRPRFASEFDDDDGVDATASLELDRPATGGVTVVRQPMPTVMIHLPATALTPTKVVSRHTQR